jgi:hypothetical protein
MRIHLSHLCLKLGGQYLGDQTEPVIPSVSRVIGFPSKMFTFLRSQSDMIPLFPLLELPCSRPVVSVVPAVNITLCPASSSVLRAFLLVQVQVQWPCVRVRGEQSAGRHIATRLQLHAQHRGAGLQRVPAPLQRRSVGTRECAGCSRVSG